METITIREAAERLGVSAKVVRRLIAEGSLPAAKARGSHGEEWRVDAASLIGVDVNAPARPAASDPAPASPPAAEPPAWRDERAGLLRDKAFLQNQVEALTTLLGQSMAASPFPSLPTLPAQSGGDAVAEGSLPSPSLPALPNVTAALQSSLRLVDAEDVAVIEMCSVRVLWGRPVLWRLLAREEADRAALRGAILSADAAWDAPGEEVVFIFMRDSDGAVIWGCACGPRWFGPPFEDALRSARVDRA